jgi:hypothetical protein
MWMSLPHLPWLIHPPYELVLLLSSFCSESVGVECERQSKWSTKRQAARGRIHSAAQCLSHFQPSLSQSFPHHYSSSLGYHCSHYRLLIGNIITIINFITVLITREANIWCGSRIMDILRRNHELVPLCVQACCWHDRTDMTASFQIVVYLKLITFFRSHPTLLQVRTSVLMYVLTARHSIYKWINLTL